MPHQTPQQQANHAIRGHILFTIGVLLLLALAWFLLPELEILYVSALFAVVLTPLVEGIRGWNLWGYRPSRPIALLILLGGTLLALVVFLVVGLPPVVRDLHQFSIDLPPRIPATVERLKNLPMADHFGIDALAERIEGGLASTASYIVGLLPLWLGHVFDIVTAIFLCVYFMLEGDAAYRFFLNLVAPRYRSRLDETLKRAELRMSKWLVGQGILMLTLGVTSTLVFGLLHVRYFFLLGVLMGLFNIIPIAGGIFTTALAATIAALDSWPKLLGVIAFYIVYVNIENAILIPRTMRSSVDLMGLTVLISLMIGTALAGITGALVAVPTAALIAVLLDEYAVHKP
ncbi:MAG: AI-2E family transporter [Acidobacteriota bacterium]|nr:AI-2E family transporter [Acidobacteriota bacterium]